MFTGIVEERGHVRSAQPGRIVVEAGTVGTDSGPGASVSVNGVCLTVVSNEPRPDGERRLLSFDVSPETRARTTLGTVRAQDPVNLERPVTLAARMGGHMVQGHVDGVGEVVDVRGTGEGCVMTVGLPPGLGRYAVEKGSITVDGVSLTIVATGADRFSVSLIPHTLAVTTLGERGVGDRVNLEVDIVAKYVERLMEGVR